MMDSIGLGEFLANGIVIFSLGISFLGWVLLYKFGRRYVGNVWLSCSLNVSVFLYFLGTASFLITLISTILWPIANVILLLYGMVLFYRKNKTIQ